MKILTARNKIRCVHCSCTAEKIKFCIKDFLNKCDQIRRKLWIWSHLQKKSLMENIIFCAVLAANFFIGSTPVSTKTRTVSEHVKEALGGKFGNHYSL